MVNAEALSTQLAQNIFMQHEISWTKYIDNSVSQMAMTMPYNQLSFIKNAVHSVNNKCSGVARICWRRGKAKIYVMGHSRRTSRPGAAGAGAPLLIIL